MSEPTRVLPAEPFWETISAEQMEARLEFAPWTAKESVSAGEKCADGRCGDPTVTVTVEASSSQSWGSEE